MKWNYLIVWQVMKTGGNTVSARWTGFGSLRILCGFSAGLDGAIFFSEKLKG